MTPNILDRATTPLNACSLEVYRRPIHCRGNDSQLSSLPSLPLIIGCYQLNEGQGDSSKGNCAAADGGDETNSVGSTSISRSGDIRLHMIRFDPETQDDMIAFGDPEHIVETESGILDGKWLQRAHLHCESDQSECSPVFASACASGRLHVHALVRTEAGDKWRLSHVASSKNESDCGICLSLDWDEFTIETSGNNGSVKTQKIVSSYSKGKVAIHEVDLYNATISETQRWDAHTLFGCPSEVWTCCFLDEANHVVSGGDDCKLKMWDVRCNSAPTCTVGEEEFHAGVTAVSTHPRVEHIFASGSYDEAVRIWDTRYMSAPLYKEACGGGIWRIKWHPSDDERMLVGAMHGGCRVLNVSGLKSSTAGGPSMFGAPVQILNKFTAHKSMAYGADWLCYPGGEFEAAASCSFYDRQAFIWDTTRTSSN